MTATKDCPLCGGSTFRQIEGSGNGYQICECTLPDLEDTPEQKGFQEGFLAGYKAGVKDGEASAPSLSEEPPSCGDTGSPLVEQRPDTNLASLQCPGDRT